MPRAANWPAALPWAAHAPNRPASELAGSSSSANSATPKPIMAVRPAKRSNRLTAACIQGQEGFERACGC